MTTELIDQVIEEYIKKNTKKKDHRYLITLYQILCRLNEDVKKGRIFKDKNEIIQECVKHSRFTESNVIKYLNSLYDLGLPAKFHKKRINIG